MGGNAYDWFNTDTGGSDSAPPPIGNDGPPATGGNAYDWFNADTPSSGDQTRADTAIGNDGPPPDSTTLSDTSQTDTTKKKQQEEYSAPQIGNDGAPSMATAQQDYGDQTTWTPTEANAYSSEKVAEHAVDRAQQTQSPDDVTFARSTIDDAQKYGAAEQQRFQTLASDEGNVNQAYNTAYADAQQKRAAAGGEYGANLLAGTSPGLSQPILDAGEQSFTTPSGQPVVRKSGDGYDTWTIAGADDPSNVLYQDERGAWSAISRDTAQQLAAQGVPGARFASVANADSIAGNAVASTGEQPSWGRGIQSGLFALSALALPINPGDAALAGLTDTVGEGLTAANTAIPGIGFGGAVKANGVQAVANMLLNGLPEHIPGSNIPIPEFAQHPLAMFLDNPTGVVDTMRKVVEGMMNPQAPAVASLEQDVQDAFTQSNADYWRQRGLQDAGVGALLVGGLGLHQQDGGLLHFIGADPHSTVARYQTAFQQALDGGKTPEEAATLGTQSVEDTLGNLLWAWNPYNPAYTQLTFPGLEGAVNTVIGRAGRPVEALGTEFAATPAVTDTLLSRADVVAQSLSRNPFALAAPNAAEKITQMVADRLPFAAADQAYPLAQDLYGLATKIDEDALAAGVSTTSSRLSLSQGTRILAQQFAEKWPGLTDGAALSLAGSIRDGFATAIPAAGKLAARDLGQVTTGTVAKALENRLAEMAGYTLSSPDVKEYLYRTGSSVAQVDGQRFIQGAIKDAITQDLRRYYYNLAGVSLPAEQTALRQVINGGVGALGNAMRAAFLVAGAPAIAVQKVLDEMVRAATQGVFGPFGIRPADMATTRAFSRLASERGLGVGDWLGDRSAVNRYLENGVSPPASILRDAQANGIWQGVRGVSPYGEKLSAGQRALALNPIAAANRAIDKFINITIQSPTQHIILNAANKAYIEQAGGMRNIVENVVDRFNRTPGIAATDLARYTDSLRAARSLGEFKAVMDDYTAHYGSLPDNRGFGGGNGIPSIGTNGTPDLPLPETPIGANGHSPAPLPEQPIARPTRGAANGKAAVPPEMMVRLPQTEAEVPAYVARVREVLDTLPAEQQDAVINEYRRRIHQQVTEAGADTLAINGLNDAGLRSPYTSPRPSVRDTVWYHGSAQPDLAPSDLYTEMTRNTNLFGPGLYLTDNPQIADSYATTRARQEMSGTPTRYEVNAGGAQKVLDLETPAPKDVRQRVAALTSNPSDWEIQPDPDFVRALNDPKATTQDIIEALRTAKQDGTFTADWGEVLTGLNVSLSDAGYDGLTHTGGQRVGNVEHRVFIALDPNGARSGRAAITGLTAAERDNPLAREAQARQQLGRDYDPGGYSTPGTHIAPGTDVGASLRPFEAPQGAEAMGYDGGIGMPGLPLDAETRARQLGFPPSLEFLHGETEARRVGFPPSLGYLDYLRNAGPPSSVAFPNPDVAAHNANRALIGKVGQDYAAAQRAVPQRANELATNIIGNPADQTNIGAALRNGWQVNGYSVLPAVLPFANFHIHTTQFWLRYFAEHPVMPVMIAKSLMNAGIDDYGYMPTDNGGAVGGATRLSTAAHLMDWGIKSWQYFSDLRRNPNGNSLLQQAEKNLAYNTIGNNAFIGAFPEEAGLLSGIAQSTTNPLLGKKGATDPRDVLRERGSENWIEGGLNLAGVNRDWSHAIGGAGNTASNLGMSAGVNLANALGGDANLKAYNSTASLDFVARGLARQLGWDDNRTEFALADIKRNQNDPQTYPLGKDGQALMDAYRHQQDVAGLSKVSPITYRPPDEKPIFPAENAQSFLNARGNAGTGGVPYNQDTRQYETALKQLGSKDFPTNDYGRDYLKTTGVFDQTNGRQPSEQRTTQAQQRQDAEILRASINTGTYLSPADRQKLQDYTNAEEAYKGLPAGTRGDLTVTELLSQPGNYYDTIRKAEAALQSGNKDLAQAYFDLADKLQTSQGKNVQDFFTTTATAGARDDIKRLNLRKDDALLNPDVQRGLAPLNRVGEAFRNPQTGEVIQPGQTFAPTARNQSSPTIKGERQYYDQWTQPQRDAYDAYVKLEGSDIAKHYFDLSHQIPDKATDPKGFSAWFKDNGTRYNEAANAYRQSLMDIRSRTGVNPLEVANEMHLTKGQTPLGSTTIPELRSQNPDVPKTNGNTGQPGSGTGAGSQKNPYGQGGKNSKTQPGKNAPVSEALSAAQALRDVYFALSKAEKSEVLKAVPNISRLVARGTNYTAEEYTQAHTSLERALKGQGAGAGLPPTLGYDRTGAPIRGHFTPTAATAQFVGNEVVSGANLTGRVSASQRPVAASSGANRQTYSLPSSQTLSGHPTQKSAYPSIGVAGSPRAAAYTSNYGTSSNRKGR